MDKDSNLKALTLLLILSLASVVVTTLAINYLTLPQRVTQVIKEPEKATVELTVGNYSLLNTSWGQSGFSLKPKVLTTNVIGRDVSLIISQPNGQNTNLAGNYTKLILHVQYNVNSSDFLTMDLLHDQSVTSGCLPFGRAYFDYCFEWTCKDTNGTETSINIELLVSLT